MASQVVKLPEEKCVYLNGEFVANDEAKVSILDHGLMYGDGIFENVKLIKGRMIALDEHIDRLYRSAKAIKLDLGMPKEEIRRTYIETVRRSGVREGNSRVTVTRGEGLILLDPRIPVKPTIIIFAWAEEPSEAITTYHPEKEGVKLMTASTRRTPSVCKDARIKSTTYMNNILARIEAIEAGCDAAIMLDINNDVSEAEAANIFSVKDGVLITPPLKNILDGITRKTVMRLAKKEGYEVMERDMTIYDLYTADEVLLTANHLDVMPVREIDGRKIGEKSPGPVTAKLQELFFKWCLEEGVPIPE